MSSFETTDRFAPLAQFLAQQNAPGQSALRYRFATYRTAYQQMLADLQTHPSADASLPVLPLSSGETQNWTVGLLQGWAMVIDVLTFYEERIANEGFIRTATERRSLLELAQAVGYQPGPGVAASTALAFTVRQPPGSAAQAVRIPAGTAVQSVPTQGQKTIGAGAVGQPPTPDQLPQVFETSAAFEARPEWNAFGLASRDGLQWGDVRPDSTALRLAGVKNNLKPGDTLLVVGSQADAAGQPQAWLLAEIVTVETNARAGLTLVTIQKQAGVEPSGGQVIPAPAVYVLRRQAGLRPYDQGGVHFSPADAVAWSPSSLGLPNTPVHDLVQTEAGALLAATDLGVFRSNDDGQSWQDASAGLMKAKIFSLAAGAGQRIYCASDSGAVYVSADGGSTWKVATGLAMPARRGLAAIFSPAPANASLPKAVVRRLLATVENGAETLVAATDKGVFLSADQGGSWKPANLGDLRPGEPYGVAWALNASASRWKRLVGTDKGVFPITPADPANPIVAAVMAVLGGLITYQLWAITQDRLGLAFISIVDTLDGLFFNLPRWAQIAVQVTAGLALVVGVALLVWWIVVRVQRLLLRLDPLWMAVRALAAQADNTIFAGTAGGVYRWDDAAKSWSAAGAGLVEALFSVPAAGLAADLDGGNLPEALRQAFEQNKIDLAQAVTLKPVTAGQSWQLSDNDAHINYSLLIQGEQLTVLRPPDVRALLLGAPGTVYAGTAGGSVFRSTDGGATWTNFSGSLRAGEVDTLVASGDGLFAGGAPGGSDPDGQWTRLHLQRQQVDLDKLYTGLLPGSWAVLRQGAQAALYKVTDVSVQPGAGGRRVGSVSSLRVAGPAPLQGFDRNLTQALAQSETLSQFDDTPASGTRLAFDRFVPGLEPGHLLAVSGRRMRLLLSGSASVPLVSPDGLAQQPAEPGDSLVVMAPPQPASNGAQTWLLQDRHGFTGQATLDASQAVLQPSQEDDETVAEICCLADASTTAPTSVLLSAPLLNLYDRSTVSVSANVAPATHGQTVQDENLGGADRSAAHPVFTLKNKPLTYIPSQDGRGVVSTLSVAVNQVQWQAAQALNELSGDQRAYVVRQDAADRTQVMFGDGVHGARLPGGADTVSATYRVGLGEAGNLPPNSLTLLRTRPPGIQGVTNPVAASGGAGPDGPDVLRRRAPQQVRNPERLVTLRDYEDFALAFGGIAKAQARPVWDGRVNRLHLTVAGEGGVALGPQSGLYSALQQAVLAQRAPGAQPVQIDSYERLVFDLKATLVHDPTDARLPEQVAAAAVSALEAAFAFEERDFGQPAAASELIAVLQGVAGVLAVELEAFSVHGQPAVANSILEALPARLVGSKILPAQLLLIDAGSPQGIQIEVQSPQEGQ